MKKYTKKQQKAIENLLIDLDELENKPNRLFYALEELATVFQRDKAIPSLREAQDLIYRHIVEGETYNQLFKSLRKYKIREWKWQIKSSPRSIENSETRIRGAKDYINLHIQELSDQRFY